MMNDPIDAILTTEIDAQGPGAAVAIVKDGSLFSCNCLHPTSDLLSRSVAPSDGDHISGHTSQVSFVTPV